MHHCCDKRRVFAFCAAWIIFSTAAFSQTSLQVELQPVLTSGLDRPVLLTDAGDGTGRRFVVEQPGRILVLPPNSSSPKTFLDITDRVRSGNEQGLLGLAFHPQFPANGRFFVSYTRRPDGAGIVAEYEVSAGDPDAAAALETPFLMIAQPFANHNGGMIEFGPDGFLYIGIGDGGSGNDPENRAQDISDLLGKILRIDVDRKDPGLDYAIPADNPFTGNHTGRDEIYASGLRNPWRFSFDRLSGRLYAGDVGQNQIEEIDLITLGGNYGWRILEGTRCTNLGPSSCSSDDFIPPVVEYGHNFGRCSVTGGYVYRGDRQTLPYGSYVYGDFCSGEVFLLNAGLMEVLLDTDLRIASFGEDEAGEIYVLDHGGAVFKIVNPKAPVHPTFHFPRLSTGNEDPFGGEDYLGLAVSDVGAAGPDLTFSARSPGGLLITDQDVVNPAVTKLAPGTQLALLAGQIFGGGFSGNPRAGWIQMESTSGAVAPFFLSFNSSLSVMDGAPATSLPIVVAILPEVEESGFTQIHVGNPHADAMSIRIELMGGNGMSRASALKSVEAFGIFLDSAEALFADYEILPSDYFRITASPGAVTYQHLGLAGRHVRGLNGMDGTAGSLLLYSPQYVVGGNFGTTISLVNLDAIQGEVTLRFWEEMGIQTGETIKIEILPHGKIVAADPRLFGDFGNQLTQGYVEIRSNGPRLTGSVSYHDSLRSEFSTALPLVRSPETSLVLSQIASNETYFTGLVIVNPQDEAVDVLIEVYDNLGILTESRADSIPARARLSGVLTQIFPSLIGRNISSGYATITAGAGVAGFGVFGTHSMSVLSAIPAGAGR